MAKEEEANFYAQPFLVGETGFVMWDTNPKATNLRFLDNIDIDYFDYIAECNIVNLDGENKQRAAISLRQGYFHALETLFSLICGVLQAPECPAGYMIKYKTQIRDNIRSISAGQSIATRFEFDTNWMEIAKWLCHPLQLDSASKSLIVEKISQLFKNFSNDFLRDEFWTEHNSIKHGLRLSSGGFELSIGLPEGGEEGMESLGESVFGSSFYYDVNLDKRNFVLKHQGLNWNPLNAYYGLKIASQMIGNVISIYKMCIVKQAESSFKIPTDEFWEKPWEHTGIAVPAISYGNVPKFTEDQLWTAKMIKDSYPLRNEFSQ